MSTYTVLIVDDDDTTHEVLGEYLTAAGFAMMHASCVQEGLDLMADREPDLILLDVQMPELDGFQMLDLLKKNPVHREIPVIFLTSLDRFNLKVKGLEMGAEDYVTKPFNKAEILARTKAALRRSARYRQLEGTLQGNLADVSLPELLQTLELGRKTAVIRLEELDGEIFLQEGLFSQARHGSFTGEEALQRLLFLGNSLFSVHFEAPSVATGTPHTVQASVLRAATALDETIRILAPCPAGNPLLELTAGREDIPEISALKGMFPVHLRNLVAAMPGTLQENAECLARAFAAGVVTVAD